MSAESINGKLVTVLHMDDDNWVDALGNNDGTDSGGPTFSNTSPAPILGTYSGDFDTIDDYVSTGNTGLDKDQGAFHFLFAPSRAGNDGLNWIPFIWGVQASPLNRILFIKRTTNVLSLEINVTSAQAGVSTAGWAADSIHQIIGIWKNGTQKLYADGVLIKTLAYLPLTAKNANVYINGDSSLKGGGIFDEVAYFDDVFTDSEVDDGEVAGGEIAELFNNGNYFIFNAVVSEASRVVFSAYDKQFNAFKELSGKNTIV